MSYLGVGFIVQIQIAVLINSYNSAAKIIKKNGEKYRFLVNLSLHEEHISPNLMNLILEKHPRKQEAQDEV